MKIIIGLGNPGSKYSDTRHNIGFLIVQSLAARLGISLKTKRFGGILGKAGYKNESTLLFMPMTFMNLSGEAVAKLTKNIPALSDILVISDDVDLKLGNIRIRKKGTHGGHKGLSSIIEELGTEDFPRLRIGVRNRDRIEDTAAYVLAPFSAREKALLKGVIDKACGAVITWIEEGVDAAMNKFNRRDP